MLVPGGLLHPWELRHSPGEGENSAGPFWHGDLRPFLCWDRAASSALATHRSQVRWGWEEFQSSCIMYQSYKTTKTPKKPPSQLHKSMVLSFSGM